MTGIAWVRSGFVARERTRRGVLAFVGVVFFGWFGVYESTLRALGWAGAGAESWIVFAAWVAAPLAPSGAEVGASSWCQFVVHG